jgi:multisubunit Na+/H+ antiporter MnhB subunit
MTPEPIVFGVVLVAVSLVNHIRNSRRQSPSKEKRIVAHIEQGIGGILLFFALPVNQNGVIAVLFVISFLALYWYNTRMLPKTKLCNPDI